ncbi:PD-(D/E)XK nuclease family protein [Methanolobus sp. ZRKC3]|uniref:PD-(D/E)XK nuclease family protein n=1 Tax=Methanolobus sp. ZRKC3 TaxID=3125786 RepID=UPI0032525711
MDDWLRYFKISNIDQNDIFISTQESFGALDSHFSGSRPDILIELSDDSKNELIFVECKIGSCEGHNQLKRYAEHLDNIEHIGCGVLIYITKDYDKKNELAIFQGCNNRNRLKFIQLRWYEIYQFLKSHDGYAEDILVKEALKFMEEYDLSGDNRFTSVDILALTNFPRVRKMMDETMYGEVSDKFTEITGGVSQSSFCLNQIKNHNRYTYIQNQNDKILKLFWDIG